MTKDNTSDKDNSANDVACWDCKNNATDRLEEMFVTLIQRERIRRGQKPALRTVFLKQHGVAWGAFEPVKDLPKDMRIGVFADGTLPCWVRFSSDTQPTSPDLHSTLGVGIKLFGVTGGTLMGPEDTADFILQNHDVFFVDNAEEFCEFTTAGVVDGDYPAYLRQHRKTARILNEMQKAESSCLSADYWAILPFAFGPDRYVKYRLTPVGAEAGEPSEGKNYLAEDLARRLRQGEAKFAFQIQLRQGDEPLDRATERWTGDWQTVAHLRLPKQDICARGQDAYGEHLSFNIWRTPGVQEPQGSIAEARRVVYQGSADQRRRANGVSVDEPTTPREHAEDVPKDACIVSAAIYPAIGVCRVGNSPDKFYIGPEVAEPAPKKPGTYRDSKGRLKREAARFRVYGLNALGQPVKELTAQNAELHWHVKIENQKSSWYQFQLAMDIPEFAQAPASLRRNADVADRAALRISPKAKTISGVSKKGKKHAFDDGQFMGKPVYLGELQTDDAGRLIVLGGHGVSASHDGSPAVTFANNEGWHDDTSDGPVTARVTYQGVELKVDPAWVICAPPNYAPQLKSVRTMWDLMRDVAVEAGMLAHPARPSFQKDIRPIFERMSALQWVNQGFAAGFGHGAPFDFSDPDRMARLADPSPARIEERRVLANSFRHFEVDGKSPVPWPWLYGDAMNIPPVDSPRQHATLSDLQLWALEKWVVGDFDADYVPNTAPARSIDEVPVAEQPDMLTRAVMEFCLADAFHPGCEMTWPMRQKGMYSAAFRLKHRKPGNPEPSFGAQLGAQDWTLPDGPVNGGQSPGSITRWMAVPWQTDTASCRSGYTPDYDPYLPTFWPARVPNEVMGQVAYGVVTDENAPMAQRLQAFANRANWLQPLDLEKSYTHQINHMIHHFDQMGVVEVRPGVEGDPAFPTEMQVSDQHQKGWKAPNVETEEGAELLAQRLVNPPQVQFSLGRNVAAADLERIEKVRRFAKPG